MAPRGDVRLPQGEGSLLTWRGIVVCHEAISVIPAEVTNTKSPSVGIAIPRAGWWESREMTNVNLEIEGVQLE